MSIQNTTQPRGCFPTSTTPIIPSKDLEMPAPKEGGGYGFGKIGDAIVDGLIDAFVDAIAQELDKAIDKAINDICAYIEGAGQADGFDGFGPAGPMGTGGGFTPFGSSSPSTTPNTGGGDFGGGGAGGSWEDAPVSTTRSNTPVTTNAQNLPLGPQRIDAVLDRLDVERTKKYLPTGPKGARTTHCNEFAQDALTGMGVPNVPKGMANQMNTWFNTQGKANGWRQVSAAEAQRLANEGRPTVATWKNTTGPHGHIGIIRPGQLKNGSPTMAQAGGKNFNKGTVAQGFGSKQPQYFVYEGPLKGGGGGTTTSKAPVGAMAGASLGGTVSGAGRNDLGGFRSNQYDGIIREMAAKYGVPARLIKSVIEQESKFIPTAGSPVGARGLMQLMPGTSREMGVKNPLDPRQNIEGGTKYLARMLKMFKGNVGLALAAYNAGPGNVMKYRGIPPFRETQGYVRNITANYYKAA